LTDSRASGASRITTVVRSAVRRRFAVVAVEQLAFALAPVFGGIVILLLAGTQILHWYWLAMLALAGLVVGVTRIRARSISAYRTAQILDSRLRLEDSLSTAWFLVENNQAREEGVAGFQLRQAEEIAARVEPSQAFPFTWQRAWSLTGALAAVAFGLFCVRYLVTRSLSLEQPLIPVQIAPVFERLESRLMRSSRLPGDSASRGRTQQQADQTDSQLPDQKTAQTPQGQREQTGDAPDPNSKSGSKTQSDKSGNPQNGEGQSRDGSANAQTDAKQTNQPAGDPTKPQNADSKRQSTGGQQGTQGLMDRMKDALSSFMSKMRENSSQQAQQSNRPSNEDKAGSQNSGKAQQGQQQDARNQQASQDQSSEGQAQGQASEKTQASQGHSSDSMPEKGADAHSGIGRQDGDKDVKEAEQLQAMGKLAEIIGKRSASLTGDMTVETPSGKQQLKTAYSQKLGHHIDSGGEINRDEIPLADQQYVREYMELVRKQSKTEH
jgi:hypothetical protein